MLVPQNDLFVASRRHLSRPEFATYPAALRVYIALVGFSNVAGQCWPSLDQLAESASMHRDNVPRALKRLRSMGLVSWVPGGRREGGNVANLYTLTPSPVENRGAITVKAPGYHGRRKGAITITTPTNPITITAVRSRDSQPQQPPEGEPLRDTNRIREILEAELGRPA